MSDPLVSEIPVHPSQEPFVDLAHFDPEIAVDPSFASRSLYYSFVRLSVAKRLSTAKQFLPEGIRFLIKEGYRPLHIQERAFDRAVERVKAYSSNHDLRHCMAEASKYVAPPHVAPHPTGGAVDLTLIDENGAELDLGTPYDAIPEESYNATFFDAANISDKARENRRILARVLQAAGFVNYFTEWWHWSYGDRYWAVMTRAAHALYPPVSEEELANLLRKELFGNRGNKA